MAIVAVVGDARRGAASRATRPRPHHVDVPGVVTVTVGLAALVLALVEGNAWGWGSPAILGAARARGRRAGRASSSSSAAAPSRWSTSRFFRSRSFLGANLVAFIVTFAMLAMFFFLALYMQNVQGYSPLEAGVRFLPSTVVIIIVGPIAGRLTDRIGPRPLMTAGLLIVAASLFWQGHLTRRHELRLPRRRVRADGHRHGPRDVADEHRGDERRRAHKAGVASGILSMSRMVGGTFGVAAMGALVTALGSDRLAELAAEPARGPSAASSPSRSAPAGRRSAATSPPRCSDAFVHALNTGLRVGAVVSRASAPSLTWALIAAQARPAGQRRAGRRGRGRRARRRARWRSRSAAADPAPRLRSRRRMHVLDRFDPDQIAAPSRARRVLLARPRGSAERRARRARRAARAAAARDRGHQGVRPARRSSTTTATAC